MSDGCVQNLDASPDTTKPTACTKPYLRTIMGAGIFNPSHGLIIHSQQQLVAAYFSKVEHGVAGGSMNGSLRLKTGDLGDATALKFNLFVGDVRQGPFECSFAERTVQEFQLEVDWRKHVERNSDSLCLRLEVLSA